MKAIKHTNLKTLTVLAVVLLTTVSLAIPLQESRAQDGTDNTKGDKNMRQLNKCGGDATCINIICISGEMCIIPPLNDPFKLPF
jgi:hypothetical protein